MALLWTEGGALMDTQTQYSEEADRLLAEAGYDELTEPAFEAQWQRVITKAEVEIMTDGLTVAEEGGPEVTMRRLVAGCTRRQREVWRMARRLQPQARRRRVALSTMLAEHMGLSRQAVQQIMTRIYCRIEYRYRELTSREPSEQTWALWRAEQAQKRRQVYRRPARGWISAYCWARRHKK
jgi:hypothetical protein